MSSVSYRKQVATMQRTSNSDEDHLYRSLPVVFLVLLLLGLSACGESFDSTCSDSQATILSACTPSSPPKHIHKVSHVRTKVKKLKPTPAPTPIVVTSARIIKSATHYLDLVLEGRYREAYAILSAALRAQEPFADFVKNPNYSLFTGCWKSGHIMSSPRNSQHFIENVQS